MEIKTRLTLQFTLIVALIQLFLSLAIYVSFSTSRVEDLYTRLEAKAASVGQMMVDIDEIDATVLGKIEKNNPMSLPDEKVVIYDHQDSILFTNDEKREIRADTALINKVRTETYDRSRIGDFEVLGMYYTSPKDKVVVFVAAKDIYGFRKLHNLRLILILVFIAGLVLVYIAGRYLAGKAVAPILSVMKQVDKIGITNLNQRLDEGNQRDEIARLSGTFNKLLERLESSFKMQKHFIANASHELNTPLTIITGKLEVALIKSRTNEQYAEAIKSTLLEIKNLNQLSHRLLLWTQANSEITKANFSVLRIDDILWHLRSDFGQKNPEYKIKINIDENIDDQENLSVMGHELLLKIAFSNIIDNGCKYSDKQTINITLSNASGYMVLHFVDNGFGIPEDELAMIFQPFFRGKNTRNRVGHGIGLSLTQEVIALHQGSLFVFSKTGLGTDIEVRLPLANNTGH